MMFKFMAPFYDRFIRITGIDHSRSIPDWLAPVKDMELLDLGGGTGMNAETLSRAGAKVTVADASQTMLRRAAAKKMSVQILHAKAEALPLPDEAFDIVLISDAWHHFRDQDGVLREVARVLRPAGRLYIIDFDAGRRGTKILAFFERLLAEPSAFPKPGELVEKLRQADIEGACCDLNFDQFIYSGSKKKDNSSM
jgi:demethylmenaquinone methyltransferase/2-methoxy-6-polyprenyl-1,4-benzoquinol methylase